MPKPARWLGTLQAAKNEASLATRLYNDPSEIRSFEGFIVHMHLAWLYLLHARFTRDGIDYRYWRKDNPRRLERVDGEVKCWELARCVRQHWPETNSPARKNIEFFIALRNRIEHRHSAYDQALALAVAGKAQSLLLNFESEMTSLFGSSHSMAAILRFPVFIGTFTNNGLDTLEHLRNRLPRDLQRFIADFHSGLPDRLHDDPKFEMRLKVILERVNRDPNALALQFVHWDDLTPEEQETVQRLGREGKTVIRERTRSVISDGLLRPTEVAARVAAEIPFEFTIHNATQCWKNHQVRPAEGDPHPERTEERYCIYDALAGAYGYKDAWVRRVIKECQTATGFRLFTGCEPRAKSTTD